MGEALSGSPRRLDPSRAMAKSCAMAGLLGQCALIVQDPERFNEGLGAEAVRTLRVLLGKQAWREPAAEDSKKRAAWLQKIATAAQGRSRELMEEAGVGAGPQSLGAKFKA